MAKAIAVDVKHLHDKARHAANLICARSLPHAREHLCTSPRRRLTRSPIAIWQGMIHGDLKPHNIVRVKEAAGKGTPDRWLLIDLDASAFLGTGNCGLKCSTAVRRTDAGRVRGNACACDEPSFFLTMFSYNALTWRFIFFYFSCRRSIPRPSCCIE